MFSESKIKKGEVVPIYKSLKFPHKLWQLVNECDTGAIRWNDDGQSVVIDVPKFQDNYLFSTGIFKTANVTSLIRQLNLYGFKKYKYWEKINPNIVEFKHKNFLKGRPDLLHKVRRRTNNAGRGASKEGGPAVATSSSSSEAPYDLTTDNNSRKRNADRKPADGRRKAKAKAKKCELIESSSSGWYDSESSTDSARSEAQHVVNKTGAFQLSERPINEPLMIKDQQTITTPSRRKGNNPRRVIQLADDKFWYMYDPAPTVCCTKFADEATTSLE